MRVLSIAARRRNWIHPSLPSCWFPTSLLHLRTWRRTRKRDRLKVLSRLVRHLQHMISFSITTVLYTLYGRYCRVFSVYILSLLAVMRNRDVYACQNCLNIFKLIRHPSLCLGTATHLSVSDTHFCTSATHLFASATHFSASATHYTVSATHLSASAIHLCLSTATHFSAIKFDKICYFLC